MKTIEEKNRMIAEFMNLKFKDDNEYINELKEMRSNGVFFEQGYMTSELKFHTSWDWLMPVVYRIHDLLDYEWFEEHDSLSFSLFPSSIDELHGQVIEFIEWYNENK